MAKKSREELLKLRQNRMQNMIQEEKQDNPLQSSNIIKQDEETNTIQKTIEQNFMNQPLPEDKNSTTEPNSTTKTEQDQVIENSENIDSNENNLAKNDNHEVLPASEMTKTEDENKSEDIQLKSEDQLTQDSIVSDANLAKIESNEKVDSSTTTNAINTEVETRTYNKQETPLTVFRLNHNNFRYIEIMAAQKGMSYRDYINEELEKIHAYLDTIEIDPFAITPPAKEERFLKCFEITQDNLEFINTYKMKFGMKKADFVNYLFDMIRMR